MRIHYLPLSTFHLSPDKLSTIDYVFLPFGNKKSALKKREKRPTAALQNRPKNLYNYFLKNSAEDP